MAAILDDDELWQEQEELPQKPKEAAAPPLKEWGMQEALLASVVDAVTDLTSVVIRVAGGKTPRVVLARPQTAGTGQRAERSKRAQLDLIEVLAPGR